MTRAHDQATAKFSLLQLALPAKPVLNIGILLFDPATEPFIRNCAAIGAPSPTPSMWKS